MIFAAVGILIPPYGGSTGERVKYAIHVFDIH